MRSSLMRVDWRRILGEGVVIIASILLALWVDARVEQRYNAALERDYLRSLETDLREDSVALAQTLTNARQRLAAGGALLPVMAGEAAPGPEFITDLMRLGNMEEFRPVALTVDELRDTGRMRLISDRELLRTAMRYYREAEYPALAALVRERNLLAFIEEVDVLLGVGVGSERNRRVLRVDNPHFGWGGPGPLPIERLRRSRRLTNAIDALTMAAAADTARLGSLSGTNRAMLGTLRDER